jgi:hypothetical protein
MGKMACCQSEFIQMALSKIVLQKKRVLRFKEVFVTLIWPVHKSQERQGWMHKGPRVLKASPTVQQC